jgi:hypothetical protein
VTRNEPASGATVGSGVGVGDVTTDPAVGVAAADGRSSTGSVGADVHAPDRATTTTAAHEARARGRFRMYGPL